MIPAWLYDRGDFIARIEVDDEPPSEVTWAPTPKVLGWGDLLASPGNLTLQRVEPTTFVLFEVWRHDDGRAFGANYAAPYAWGESLTASCVDGPDSPR